MLLKDRYAVLCFGVRTFGSEDHSRYSGDNFARSTGWPESPGGKRGTGDFVYGPAAVMVVAVAGTMIDLVVGVDLQGAMLEVGDPF